MSSGMGCNSGNKLRHPSPQTESAMVDAEGSNHSIEQRERMAKSILDKSFHYINAVSTDISKTIARARLRLKREAEQRQRDEQETENKVQTITRRAER